MYLYRAVDQSAQTVDFYLSRQRDVAAAKAFLRKAMREPRTPQKITLDAYAASHCAVADLKGTGALPKRVQVRSSLKAPHCPWARRRSWQGEAWRKRSKHSALEGRSFDFRYSTAITRPLCGR